MVIYLVLIFTLVFTDVLTVFLFISDDHLREQKKNCIITELFEDVSCRRVRYFIYDEGHSASINTT